jgi:hypothetical protein
MNNIKAAMIIYGAINIAEGIIMWFGQGLVVKIMFNVSYISSQYHFLGYVLAMLGAASIAAGLLMVVAGFKPIQNFNAIRFAILWSALILLGQIYSLGADYVTWSNAGFIGAVIINLVILLALVIFYPRRERA